MSPSRLLRLPAVVVVAVVIAIAGAAPPAPGQGAPYIEWSSPTHVVANQPFTVRVHGPNMAGVGPTTSAAFLFDPKNILDNWPLQITSIGATDVDLTDPTGRAPKLWSIALLTGTDSTYSSLYVANALPVASTVTPASVAADSGATVVLTGSNLGAVTHVYLEGSGQRILMANALTPGSATSLTIAVPKGLEPDAYVVRALNDGGMSVETTSLNVTGAALPPPTVGELSPTAGFTTGAVTVLVQGKSFTGATTVVAKGDVTVNLPFLVTSDTSLTVQVPQGIATDLYDLLVTTANGTNVESVGKYVAIDPAAVHDYFGDSKVVRLDFDTVLFYGTNFGAVVKRGRLAWYYNLLTYRTLLSADRSDAFGLGIHWDTPTPTKPHAIDGDPSVTLSSIAQNTAVHGVDFVWKFKGTELFRTTWGVSTTTGELEERMSWDTHDDPRLGNAFGAILPGFSTAPGTRQYAASTEGSDYDWYALPEQQAWPAPLNVRMAIFPGHFDAPITFVADPAGGGVLVDQMALGDQCSFTTFYARARAGKFLRQWTSANFHELHLHAGSLGPIRFRPTSGNWADVVEPIQAAVVNPLLPSWMPDITHLLMAYGMNFNSDHGVTAQRLEALYQAIDAGGGSIPGSNDWRLLYAFAATSTNNDNLPDWNVDPFFASLGGAMQQGGWKVVPYIATPGVSKGHPSSPSFEPYRLARWNPTTQTLVWSEWGDGDAVAEPGEYWNINVAHAPYRNTIKANVAASIAASFPIDGIYFDFMKGNTPLDDRNLATGDAPQGLQAMMQEFVTAFGSPAHPFAIGTEGSSIDQTKAGSSFASAGVDLYGELEANPLGGVVTPIAYAHPIGTYTTLAQTKSYSSQGSPATMQIEHYVARLQCTIVGVLPTATIFMATGTAPLAFAPEGARALTQIAEEGFYWHLHHVKPWTDPSASWADPEVLRVYEVNGVPVARTKDWFVRKLVCDLYWQFGGRAPTATEFSTQVAKTKANALSVAAAVSEVRQKFQLAPTPNGAIETRPVAVQKIVALFPGYPKP